MLELGIYDDCEPDNVVMAEIGVGVLSDGSAKSIAYDYGEPDTLLHALGGGWMVLYTPLRYELSELAGVFAKHPDDLMRVKALSRWCHMVAHDERVKDVTGSVGWEVGEPLLARGGWWRQESAC